MLLVRPWRFACAVAMLGLVQPELAAQTPWVEARWEVDAREHRVERHQGREALLLRNGVAWLRDTAVRDGVIHFDLWATGDLGFHGLAFRAEDRRNYEHFYLRPFVSGAPDASQYTPVFNGVSGWQIYAGPRFGLPVEVPAERWVHVEIRVRDGRAEAYVDGQALVFPALQRAPVSGAIGVTSSGAPARFANLLVIPGRPTLDAGEGASAEAQPTGIVREWRVSTAFAESRLVPLQALDARLEDQLEWSHLRVGERGIANLARLRGRDEANNTVFASVRLRSAEARPVRLRVGFSDRARVYLNGQPLYHGTDGWRSRDYKFLGTVGLFDEVVLPLRAGENEVRIAVSEDFGGWGVMAQLVDPAGVDVMRPEH